MEMAVFEGDSAPVHYEPVQPQHVEFVGIRNANLALGLVKYAQ